MDNIGEMGQPKTAADYGSARKRLASTNSAQNEAALKAARNYGGSAYTPSLALPTTWAHQHFGQLIVSCEKADLQPGPTGITIYTDSEKIFEPLPAPTIPRIEVIDELVDTIVHGLPATHSGEWARATTAVCLGILQSSRTGSSYHPEHQVATIEARP